MFQNKNTREFECEYCPKSFSKRSSLRNHIRVYRDQMYLDETGLSHEGNITSTSPLPNISLRKLNTLQEHVEDLQNMSLDHYWQEKELDFHSDEVSLNFYKR